MILKANKSQEAEPAMVNLFIKINYLFLQVLQNPLSLMIYGLLI
jgi:hypothetical protein